MGFDRRAYIIPDGTKFDDGTIKVDGDAVIGNSCIVDFNVESERFFAGERTKINGHIITKGDVRMDLFSAIEGDVSCGANAYIADGTKINGNLSLKGDLDVGDNVEIRDGFEAKGWINIRSPIPMVIYVLLYILELIKRGHSKEVERILQELENNNDIISISEKYFFLPNGSSVGSDAIINGRLHVGKDCVITGNHKVKGSIFVGKGSAIHGSLKSSGDVTLEDGVKVEGNVEGGFIKIGLCNIAGNVDGRKVEIFRNANVSGVIKALEGIKFFDERKKKMKKKVERFKEKVDIVDEVAELL
ncbi:MAG: polymer-forming cytoskeletal protein [Candidatus Thermoplasmatota archaeon]|nr:polymer-forming cytoskeletal protein [Candidatus Thermoplasmatota archaeon]